MLLSLLATSVGIAAFNFGGGDDHALLEAVTKHFGRTAAILASDTKWKACHIKPQDPRDVQKLLRTLVKIDQSEPGRFGLSPLAWPLGVGNEPHFEEYSELFVPFPISEDAFRGGKYYLNTKGREALSFNTLATLKFEKPIRWQSFFDRVRLRVSIDGCSERELLELVARASGAKLVEGKDIEFVIDPKAWRSRSVAMWREYLKTSKLEAIRKADAEYMIELISRTEDRTIKAAFANRDQIRTFGVPWNPGTQVYNLAWKRVYLFLEQASPGDPTIALFRDVVDPRSPVYGLINPRGVPSSLFYNKDQNERVRF